MRFSALEHLRRREGGLGRRAAYGPALLEVLEKVHAGQFSLKVVEGDAGGLFVLGRDPLDPLTPERVTSLLSAGSSRPLEEVAAELAAIAATVPGRRDAD